MDLLMDFRIYLAPGTLKVGFRFQAFLVVYKAILPKTLSSNKKKYFIVHL